MYHLVDPFLGSGKLSLVNCFYTLCDPVGWLQYHLIGIVSVNVKLFCGTTSNDLKQGTI